MIRSQTSSLNGGEKVGLGTKIAVGVAVIVDVEQDKTSMPTITKTESLFTSTDLMETPFIDAGVAGSCDFSFF
jgi:hypothetical protein